MNDVCFAFVVCRSESVAAEQNEGVDLGVDFARFDDDVEALAVA